MEQKKYNLYKEAILSTYPDATNIRKPDVPGSLNNVLFADTPQGERVFKFSDEDLVLKNAKISYLYNVRGIPVPKITPREYKKLYFEDYAKISGMTLQEAINSGATVEQIQSIYRDIVRHMLKMERVYPDCLGQGDMHNAHEIAGKHTIKSHGLLIGQLAKWMVYFACKSNKAVYHFDLCPKNIIVSDDGRLKALVDMDSVGICSQNFAYGMLAARYSQIGLDIEDLFKFYNTLTASALDYDGIKRIANLRKKLLHKSCGR